jgi:hypothetical protein
MKENTAHQVTPAVEGDPRRLDVVTMRAAVAQMLADDAPLLGYEELQTTTLQLRGHLMLLIPEIEGLAGSVPGDHGPVEFAAAGVSEARRRLDELPGPGLPRAVGHAQRLARSVEALCTHLERLAVIR